MSERDYYQAREGRVVFGWAAQHRKDVPSLALIGCQKWPPDRILNSRADSLLETFYNNLYVSVLFG
jgi:hypothetical protein